MDGITYQLPILYADVVNLPTLQMSVRHIWGTLISSSLHLQMLYQPTVVGRQQAKCCLQSEFFFQIILIIDILILFSDVVISNTEM